MTYEYLKGMGAAGLSLQQNDQIRSMAPAAAGSGSGSSGSGSGSGSGVQKVVKSEASFSLPAASNTVAKQVAKIVSVSFGAVQVPAGSVATNPGERAALKEWFRQTQGTTLYNNHVASDPGFTYVNSAILTAYRNSVDVVKDMLKGAAAKNLTVGDIDAFKAWWQKCHKNTYVAFTQLYRASGKSDTWVPAKPVQLWKQPVAGRQMYKTSGKCPTAAEQKATFEYLTNVTPATLLKDESKRQEAALKDATEKAKKDAADAKKVAEKWKDAAAQADKKATDLQGESKVLQNKIEELGQQLASAPTQDTVTALQAQVATLVSQLAAVQAEQSRAQVSAQVANDTAVQADIAATQAEEVSTQVDQLYSEVAPWYVQYKWYLLGGLVALGGGLWWYLKGRQPAVALAKNGLPVPTSARRPSGLRGNPYSSNYDELDTGMPPHGAPMLIKELALNMRRSARENGDSGDAVIIWSRKGTEWHIGDNFDRYGHFVVKYPAPHKYKIIFRGEWGDARISRKQALKQARRFFNEGGAAEDFRNECYDPEASWGSR